VAALWLSAQPPVLWDGMALPDALAAAQTPTRHSPQHFLQHSFSSLLKCFVVVSLMF
jgi:hypothetical protein